MPKKPRKASQPPSSTQETHPNFPRPLPDNLEYLSQTQTGARIPTAEWLEKNAHAKAIIMSTLIPGSEPWKIAEPLEYASDIWKALEDRYAPKNDPEGKRKERADLVADWVEGKPTGQLERVVSDWVVGEAKAPQITAELQAGTAEPDTSTYFAKAQAQVESLIRDRDTQGKLIAEITRVDEEMKALKEQRKKEANAAAAKVMAEHMPNRDQRFLWALLHGGKEETMNWFNGNTVAAAGTT